MLETIREFAGEELAASGDEADTRRRHAEWCLALAEDAGPRAKQPGGAAWVAVLECEHANLRAALDWFLGVGDEARLVRLAGSLWPFWHEHTYFAEGHRWLAVAIDLGRDAPPADLIRALIGAGTLAWYQTRIEQARVWHEQALALARASGDRVSEVFALINLSGPAMEYGQYERARSYLEDGLAAARAVGETEAASLALHNLGCLAWLDGDFHESRRWNEEALALARAEGWDWLAPSILVNLGLATADLGDGNRAAALLRQGLDLGRARGNLWDVGTALEGLARVDAVAGRTRRAARLFGTAAALREETGIPQSPTDRAYYGPFLDALRGDLGAEAFSGAWADGRSTPWERVLAEQLAAPAEPEPTIALAGRRGHDGGLTTRELEVLRLLATGEGNRQIGDRLFISPRTVGSHVSSILEKLGLQTRGQAAAYARQHDLV